MSLMEISKSIPQDLDYSEGNQIYQKMIPKNPRISKNPGIAQKGTQKSGSNPKKVPKIMAHPRTQNNGTSPYPK